MKIIPEIFKAYDVRGLYPQEINEETAYRIGRALVEYTKAKKVVVGYDMRESSLKLEKRLVEGITKGGAEVIRLGLISTPMLYFASWKLTIDAGVIITASHNPAQYNGMKFCLKNAIPIGEGSGMEEIAELTEKGIFKEVKKMGRIKKNNTLKKEYIDYIISFFQTEFATKKKVVIDFANGMGIVDKEIYEKLVKENRLEVIYMYDKLDGNFPNHEANPLKTETLKDLQLRVLKEEADLGIAYDGDADRVGFVDEKGEIIPMDFPIALLAKEILKKKPASLILMDLRSSNAVKEFIEKAGGKVNRCRVGHSLIKKQMRAEGAIFAGELSGHYFFEENSKAEMTTLAVMMILNLINETGEKISELLSELKIYYQSGEINSEVKNKEVVFQKLKEKYQEGELSELDGIRIDFEDWWFNVRASNTEPKMRLNLEAKSKKLMEEKTKEVLNIIRA